MGLYDREYYRQEQPGFRLAVPRSAVVTLILINVAVFLAEVLLPRQRLDLLLSLHGDTLTRPLAWWQFLTYGFAHDSKSLWHILLNMFGLWVLGREVEERYGTREFTILYLMTVIVGGLSWAVLNHLFGGPNARLLGASGAIAGIVVLYALNFPHRRILFMFVLPMPAWLFGVMVVVMDALGATGVAAQSNVAYTVHLAGAGFAALYFFLRWNFSRLFQGSIGFPRWRRRPRLRVHQPDDDDAADGVPEEEVDRILEKIYREGENSLSRQERRILETASRAYQRRRKMDV